MRRVFWVIFILVAILVTAWLSGAFKPAEKAPVADGSNASSAQTVADASKSEAKAPEKTGSEVLDGLKPITGDSGLKVFTTVSRADAIKPVWPEGTNQTSVGYSNPEEYADGRTFMTRNPVTADEILVFVAQCVSVNGGEKLCQSEKAGAIVGYIVAGPNGEWPVTLWDAELKTLIIPGGQVAWQAYVEELAKFISSNKGGSPVEIIGPAK